LQAPQKCVRNIKKKSQIESLNSNFELVVYLENSEEIEADKYAIIIGHEAFVHHLQNLVMIDKVREKAKNKKYKDVGEVLLDIFKLAHGAEEDHDKLKENLVTLFISMVEELDKKEKTSKYSEMYEENRKSNSH
jgi:glycerol-3-phosphate cytidylyltransferase-like family protein